MLNSYDIACKILVYYERYEEDRRRDRLRVARVYNKRV
jgi:hypothetical protein